MTNDTDDRLIRGALVALKHAPVPALPELHPIAPEGRGGSFPGLAAAAALLLALVGLLLFGPDAPADPLQEAARQLRNLESRIARVEHAELRELLRQEASLMRLELEMARGARLGEERSADR